MSDIEVLKHKKEVATLNAEIANESLRVYRLLVDKGLNRERVFNMVQSKDFSDLIDRLSVEFNKEESKQIKVIIHPFVLAVKELNIITHEGQ